MNAHNNGNLLLIADPAAGAALGRELEKLDFQVHLCDAHNGNSPVFQEAHRSALAECNALIYWAPLPVPDQEINDSHASAYISRAMAPLFEASREFAKSIARRKVRGHIVTIVDISARCGLANYCIHSALTAGVLGFSKCLALELSKSEMSVNTISTGWLEQWISKDMLDRPVQQYFQLMHIGKPSTLASLAKTLLYVMDAEHVVTGTTVQLDNGCVI